MNEFEMVQLHGRTQLMLNLVRSGNMEMTKELEKESNILCAYLDKRLRSNGEIAKKYIQQQYGLVESQIMALIDKFKSSKENAD